MQISSAANLLPLVLFASVKNLSLPVIIKSKIHPRKKRNDTTWKTKRAKKEETAAIPPSSGNKRINRYNSHSQQNHNILRQKPTKEDQTCFFFSYAIIISWKEMKIYFTYRKSYIYEILSLIWTNAVRYLWTMKRLRSPNAKTQSCLQKVGDKSCVLQRACLWHASQTSYTNIGGKKWLEDLIERLDGLVDPVFFLNILPSWISPQLSFPPPPKKKKTL